MTTNPPALTVVQRTLLQRVAEGKATFGSAYPTIDRNAATAARGGFRVFKPGEFFVIHGEAAPLTFGSDHPAWNRLIDLGLVDLPDRDTSDPGWQGLIDITDEGLEALA